MPGALELWPPDDAEELAEPPEDDCEDSDDDPDADPDALPEDDDAEPDPDADPDDADPEPDEAELELADTLEPDGADPADPDDPDPELDETVLPQAAIATVASTATAVTAARRPTSILFMVLPLSRMNWTPAALPMAPRRGHATPGH